jgi:hypothetical protein
MASGSPAVDAKLVLERNDLDVVDVEEIGRTAVGIEFLLVDLKADTSWIIVAFGSIKRRSWGILERLFLPRNAFNALVRLPIRHGPGVNRSP